MVDRAIHFSQEGLRIDSHPKHHDQDGHKIPNLPLVHIRVGKNFFVFYRAVHDPLVHPEEIAGSQDNSRNAENGQNLMSFEDSEDTQYLTDKAVQPWQANRGEHTDEEEGGKDRHLLADPAKVSNLPGVRSLVKNTDNQEQCAGAQPVIEHLVDGSFKSFCVQGKDSEHDQPHVADAGIGHKRFDILLDERHQAAVDDSDQA